MLVLFMKDVLLIVRQLIIVKSVAIGTLAKLSVYSVVIFLLFSCSKDEKNDLEAYGINGRVRNLKETSYNVIEKFGEITKDSIIRSTHVEFDGNGKILEARSLVSKVTLFSSNSHFTKKYDERGNLIEYKRLNTDGSISDKTESVYDEEDRIVEVRYFDSNVNLLDIEKVIYENDSKVIYESFSKSGALSGKRVTDLDARGNIVSDFQYGFDGDLISKKISSYDSDGNLISSEESHVMDDFKARKNVYKFDGNGNEIESKYFDLDGELISVENSEYDNDRNLIKKHTTIYLKDGGTSNEVYSFLYKFDQLNNWTEKVVIKDEVALGIVERDITYL